MSDTASEPAKTFAKMIYEHAVKRAATPDGAKELEAMLVSPDQFLKAIEVFTNGIDELPPAMTLHTLYAGLNYVGAALVSVMEANKQRLENETGGKA
jgi:hypothetical protein